MNVKRKVTWKDIFNNFKSVVSTVIKRRPRITVHYNFAMSIVVYLADGTKVVYDDMAKLS